MAGKSYIVLIFHWKFKCMKKTKNYIIIIIKRKMPVVLIHKHPSLMDECCDLVNAEWPRSKTARMRTLQMSCDTLPTCLVLVAENKVLGHSKVSAIPCIPRACFVESVVIHPQYRGKGLGKMIMKETEKFAASQDMETVYLSTKDQQEFYKKLGYTECPAVSIYGWTTSVNDCSEIMQNLSIREKEKPEDNSSMKTELCSLPLNTSVYSMNLPPLPPPLPNKSQVPKIRNDHSRFQNTEVISKKTYFRKQIEHIDI